MSQFNVNVTRAQQSIAVPDTGANQIESMGGGITSGLLPVAIFTLFAVLAVAVFLHKKFKAKSLFILKKYKRLAFAIPSILLIVGVIAYCITTKIATTNAIDTDEPQDRNTLSITAEDINIDVHIEDEAVYAMAPSKVTVNSGTDFGYTLMAYIDNNDLVSDNGNKISGLDPSVNTKLQDNTWGVATVLPENQNSEVFHGLPTTVQDAMVLRSHPDVATTEAGEETTVYYGVYVTPELEEGVYSGTTINYIAVSDFTDQDIAVTYLGNGLYFDEEQTQKSNTVIYRRNCEEATAEGDEQSCSFSVSKGQYQSPIGYQGSWVFSDTYQIEDDDTVIGYLNHLNEEQNDLVTSSLGRNISMLATNDKTNILVFLGNFVDGSDNMLDQINILSYTYDENAAVGDRRPTLVEGEYIRPVNFSGNWQTDSIIVNEETIIKSSTWIPLGNELFFEAYDGPNVVYVEYDANAGDDYVENMPESPWQEPYSNIIDMSGYFIDCAEPSRDGYRFMGWYSSETENTHEACSTIPDYYFGDGDTIHLSAQWEPTRYIINYVSNDSLFWQTEWCDAYDGCIITTETPSSTTGVFANWECYGDNVMTYGPGERIFPRDCIYTGDDSISNNNTITLVASWYDRTYEVQYDEGEGITWSGGCDVLEGCIVPDPVSSSPIHTFDSWTNSDDGHTYYPGDIFFPSTPVSHFVANWEPITITTYTIYYRDDLFGHYWSEECEATGCYLVYPQEENENYRFNGWYHDSGVWYQPGEKFYPNPDAIEERLTADWTWIDPNQPDEP